jgi:C-22 sterol desaturase
MNSLFRSPFAAVPSATGTATSFDALPGGPSTLIPSWGWTAAAIVLALLALEQGVYRAKKRHLPGPGWTIPVIGKFADSMNPSMEKYKSQWDSGALSVVSVFNMWVLDDA